MRIAVSSAPLRRSFAAGELTQLEWVERCAAVLAVDGVFPDLADFPRRDEQYVAQLRKVAIDLGIVPLGIDAPRLLEPGNEAERDAALAVAREFGAALVRSSLPAPGDVPPASFVEAVGAAKAASRAAKAANLTLIAVPAPGTLGADPAAVRHLLKDVDSAWLRMAPPAAAAGEQGARERYPALTAVTADDPALVAAAARTAWLILDAAPGPGAWEELASAVTALRRAEAARRLEQGARRGDETAAAVWHPV